jgi:predicted DNA-binding transcriptional regulator YafY
VDAISSASPTARALRTLELLQARPGITADEIGRRLEVSDRAARRYVAILREAGIPVESERGRYGGYRLGRGLRLPPLVFTASEALGVVMAVLDGHHAAADPTDPVGAAVGKIIAALPDHVGRQAAAVRVHARAIPDRGASRPDPDVITALVDAIAARRDVRLEYTTGSGSQREFDVDPWAIVVRHGRWYLLCNSHTAGETRSLRVDRVRSVSTLGPSAGPPADLDPIASLERHLASGWSHRVRVEFDAPFADVRPWVGAPMGELRPTDDGRGAVLDGTTSNVDMYAAEWLAQVPYPFKVIGDDDLRAAVATVAHRLLAATT